MKDLTFVKDREISKKLKTETLKVKIIEESSFSKLKDSIKKTDYPVIVLGGKFNREILEDRKVDILLSPEIEARRDHTHYRNSGLNQVLCKLAKKNNIAIGFNFNNILHSKGKQRSEILGRMQQNVRLCKKYKVKMIVASFAKNKYELRSIDSLKAFARVLGIPQREIKKSFWK